MIRRLALLPALAMMAGCTYYGLHDSPGCDTSTSCGGRDCTSPPSPADDGGSTTPLDAEPGDPAPACALPSDCATAETCVEGACVALATTCRFDVDCGPGRSCVDNACRPVCTAATTCIGGTACIDGTCRPATTCTVRADCSGGAHCVGGRCLDACGVTADCVAGEICVGGLCRPDVAPRPFCATDADCATGSLCVAGVCRIPCPSADDTECQRSDTSLTTCSASDAGRLLCYTSHQASPECATVADCPTGLDCVDAVCR